MIPLAFLELKNHSWLVLPILESMIQNMSFIEESSMG